MTAKNMLASAVSLGRLEMVKTIVSGHPKRGDASYFLLYLCMAAKHGCIPVAQYFINNVGVNPLEILPTKGPTTLLNIACSNKQFKFASYLLSEGIPFAFEREDSQTYFAKIGAESEEEFFFKYVNLPDDDGNIALHFALTMNAPADLIHILLNCGSDIGYYVRDPCRNASMSAAESGSLDALAAVLEHGADLNKMQNVAVEGEDDLGATHIAAMSVSSLVLRLLINSGANIEERDDQLRTPLHCAVMLGCTETAILLLNEGADVLAKDCEQNTPYDYLAFNEFGEVEDELIAAVSAANQAQVCSRRSTNEK